MTLNAVDAAIELSDLRLSPSDRLEAWKETEQDNGVCASIMLSAGNDPSALNLLCVRDDILDKIRVIGLTFRADMIWMW